MVARSFVFLLIAGFVSAADPAPALPSAKAAGTIKCRPGIYEAKSCGSRPVSCFVVVEEPGWKAHPAPALSRVSVARDATSEAYALLAAYLKARRSATRRPSSPRWRSNRFSTLAAERPRS